MKCDVIKRDAASAKGELMTKLMGFTHQIKSAPLKGSALARDRAVAAPVVAEETLAQYEAAMLEARDELRRAELRAASALKAACIAGESVLLVSGAMEYGCGMVDAHYKPYVDDPENTEWPGFFRLQETAVADLASVIATWGTKASHIAEYAWEMVTVSLEGDDDLEDELAKWSRCQFLRLADKSLACVAQQQWPI